MKEVTIYTDGACSGNPGPGGWAAILRFRDAEKVLSGGERETTNNRMELTAVISALLLLRESCIVELWSDSKYVIDALETAGIRDQVKVMVGGAPVTQGFADEIGADGYSDNANSAVAVAKQLLAR